MSKEKKRSNEENNKKETLFYYEIIGVVLILVSFVILGKLGKVGILLSKFLKCIFGNWSWLIVLFLLFLGIYNLFLHKKFNLKNSRFIGFVFILISLLVYSHFPLHNYVMSKNNNYLSDTINIFKKYLLEENDNYLGGGIIGAILFYSVFYMLGSYGVILVSFLIAVLGISLLINKPIFEILKFSFKKIKNIRNYTGNFSNFFKYELGKEKEKILNKNQNKLNKNIKLPIKYLDDYVNIEENIDDNSHKIKVLIEKLLDEFKVDYKISNMIVSYRVTSYLIVIYSNFNIMILINKLQELIEGNILFSKKNGVITIQIPNDGNQIYSTKENILKQNNYLDNFIIPIGFSINNKLIEIDISKYSNILIFGEVNSGVRNFIKSFIYTIFIKNSFSSFKINIFDKYNDFEILKDIIEIKNNNLIDYIEEISNEIERRKVLFDKYKVYNINEFNQKILNNLIDDELVLRNIYIINHTNINNDDKIVFENKLLYLCQFSQKLGINLIYISRNTNNLSSTIVSSFDSKLFFKTNNKNFKTNLLGSENSNYLIGNGDYLYNDERIISAYISNKEIEKINKYLKK